MKKINLKNILKKTFKKKKSKKVKKVSKPKKIKKIVNVKKIKAPKLKTKVLKKTEKKAQDIKTDSLKISKTLEQKPEIKKVKKQQSEKREYKVKDYVVYPKHGVGQIRDFKKILIGGIEVETYVLKFEKDKADGYVPVNKQSHLNPLRRKLKTTECFLKIT